MTHQEAMRRATVLAERRGHPEADWEDALNLIREYAKDLPLSRERNRVERALGPVIVRTAAHRMGKLEPAPAPHRERREEPYRPCRSGSDEVLPIPLTGLPGFDLPSPGIDLGGFSPGGGDTAGGGGGATW